MTELRTVSISRAASRANLFLGGDREMVMMSGVLAAILIFIMQSLLSAVYGIGFWLFALFALRMMAKSDPYLRHVYLQHIRYQQYYPPRSTPFCSK